MKADPKRCMIFYTQMQNNPMDAELTDFKQDWLKYYEVVKTDDGIGYRYYDKKKEEFVTVARNDLTIKGTIDPAVSKGGTKGTARTALVIVGVTEDHKKLLLEAWARRLPKNMDLYSKVFEFHKKYKPRSWGIETFGQQRFILRALREDAVRRGIFLPITELPKDVGTNAKDIRIRSLQDDFVSGQIFIHNSMRDFISEYLAFPMGQTKDLLDALAYHKKGWTSVDRNEVNDEAEERYQRFLESRTDAAGL